MFHSQILVANLCVSLSVFLVCVESTPATGKQATHDDKRSLPCSNCQILAILQEMQKDIYLIKKAVIPSPHTGKYATLFIRVKFARNFVHLL